MCVCVGVCEKERKGAREIEERERDVYVCIYICMNVYVCVCDTKHVKPRDAHDQNTSRLMCIKQRKRKTEWDAYTYVSRCVCVCVCVCVFVCV